MRCRVLRNERGIGMLVLVAALLGLSLAAGSLLVGADFLVDRERVTATERQLKKIVSAISAVNQGPVPRVGRHYENDVGAPPGALADLLVKPGPVAACGLNTVAQSLGGWCGPYLFISYTGENLFIDAWGRALDFDLAGRRVYSWGANGVDENGAADDIVGNF